ncbi:FAD-dependent oxidoreductase [Planosporangium mesophilum]|uniref:Monooxygenase n=1 Tax=Planosporangium mesophilum TaxID=689768 RepID=A0A8J3T9A6_9ACTN|nr:NAD(P)/FAD-dependent oxidoreductase [Planosporangium mesophilum]NJC83621.1 FAD-dependent monooxygenase [Planosporangium mesophilum]GII22134.1 monooxygenase [Planosporangium mesophilum]
MGSAVVVGAGIGGLAVAGALGRAGWQVTLLERDERLRPGRAALLLWPNGVRALRALGLDEGLDAIATPVRPDGLRRPDGHWLRRSAADRSDGATPYVVHREDLHDALVAGLSDRIDIQTGVTVRAVRTDGYRPVVTDGQATWEADLVVAADGARSAVRQRLAPASQPVSGGYAAWRAVIPWYRAPELPAGTPAAGETLSVGHRFIHASLGERGSAGASSRGGIYWMASVPGAARPEPPAVQLSLLRRWLAGWHPPIGQLLEATRPEDLVQETVTELSPMPESFVFPTGGGGYVLLGDAAHAIADHLGQAACLALEDAATLRTLVRAAAPGPALVTALRAYQNSRRPRAARVARSARRLATVLQGRGSRLGTRARGMALATIAPRMLEAAASGANDWEPPPIS